MRNSSWLGIRGLVVAAIVAVCQTPVVAQDGSCVGDCDSSGEVTIDELIVGVNIALGQLPVDTCTAVDRNRDLEVTIDEIIGALVNALNGCPPTPLCTPPRCLPGMMLACPSGSCPGGCGYQCVTPTPTSTATAAPGGEGTIGITPTPTPTRTSSATPTDCAPGLCTANCPLSCSSPTPTPTATASCDVCPDLVVTSVNAVFPQARACNEPPVGDAGVQVCVTNRGNAPAGEFTVVVDGGALYSIAGLDAGASDCQLRVGFFSNVGTATVDVSDAVPESNEGNNQYEYFTAVLSPTPSCTRGVTSTPTPTPTPPA